SNARDAIHYLSLLVANRDDEPPARVLLVANFELFEQGGRNVGSAGGHEDAVVRRKRRPSERAVPQARDDPIPECLQQTPGPIEQRSVTFDRKHARAKLTQDGRLITASCTDFQNPLTRLGIEQHRLISDRKRLRDRLLHADWKR